MSLENIAALAAIIAFVFGAPFGARKLWQLLRPIRIDPIIKIVFISEPDEIRAKITNLSNEDLYVIRCEGRATWPLKIIIKRHLKNPFLNPRMYSNVRFAASTYSLLKNGPLKLEGKQQVELTHLLSKHPLSAFMAPMLQIEVELSSKRVFRSKRIAVPDSWLLLNHPDVRRQLNNARSSGN